MHEHMRYDLPEFKIAVRRKMQCQKIIGLFSHHHRTYKEKYIDDLANTEWFVKYRYDIPVIHLNDQFLMKHRVNEELLRKALEEFGTKS